MLRLRLQVVQPVDAGHLDEAGQGAQPAGQQADRRIGIEWHAAVRRERQAGSARLFVAGLLIAAIMAVPVINLLTPLYATAFIAHLFKRRAYRAA